MEKRPRRSSILKITQDTTIVEKERNGTERRVSFHNIKHIKAYDKDCGNFLNTSPVREKLADTLESDAPVTPKGSVMNNTMDVFNTTNANSIDMSIEEAVGSENKSSAKANETQALFDLTVDCPIDMSLDDNYRNMNETKSENKNVDNGRPIDSNDTQALLDMMLNEDVGMSSGSNKAQSNINDTQDLFNISVNETVDMSLVSNKSRRIRMNDTKVFLDRSCNETVDMSLDEPKSVDRNATKVLFDMTTDETADMTLDDSKSLHQTTNEAIDMSLASNAPGRSDMNITQALLDMNSETSANDTLRALEFDVSMMKSMSDNNKTMDMSLSEDHSKSLLKNKTLSVFQADDDEDQMDLETFVSQNDTIKMDSHCKAEEATKSSISMVSVKEMDGTQDESCQTSFDISAPMKNNEAVELDDFHQRRTEINITRETVTIETQKIVVESTVPTSHATEASTIAGDDMDIDDESTCETTNIDDSAVGDQLSETSTSVVNRSRRSFESIRRLNMDKSVFGNTYIDSDKDILTDNKTSVPSVLEMSLSFRTNPLSTSSIDDTCSFSQSLPEFDAAIVNIAWLTDNCGFSSDSDAVQQMNDMIRKETAKIDSEASEKRNSLNEEELNSLKRIESGSRTKMSDDEKEMYYVSRTMAEIQLLKMRLEYARKWKNVFMKELEEEKKLNEELRRKQEVSKLITNVDSIKKEIDELSQIPTDGPSPRRALIEWRRLEAKQLNDINKQLLDKLKLIDAINNRGAKGKSIIEQTNLETQRLEERLDVLKNEKNLKMAAILRDNNINL